MNHFDPATKELAALAVVLYATMSHGDKRTAMAMAIQDALLLLHMCEEAVAKTI